MADKAKDKVKVKFGISTSDRTKEKSIISNIVKKVITELNTVCDSNSKDRGTVCSRGCELRWFESGFVMVVPEKYAGKVDNFFQDIAQHFMAIHNEAKCIENAEIYLTPLSTNCFDFLKVAQNESINLDIPCRVTFGALVGYTIYHEHITVQEEVHINFEHAQRNLSLELTNYKGRNKGTYRMVLDYSSIQNFVVDTKCLFIFMGSARMKISFTTDATFTPKTVWYRVPSSEIAERFGECCTLKLQIPLKESLNHILSDLFTHSGFGGKIHYANMKVLQPETSPYIPYIYDSFDIDYAIYCLWQRGHVARDQMDADFFDSVKQKAEKQEDIPRLLNTLHLLTATIDNSKPIILKRALEKAFTEVAPFCDQILPGCKMVRKVIITPSRILPQPPEMIVGNRFLREYGEDYALRVSFRDEGLDTLTSAYGEAADVLYNETVVRNMKEGLKIGERHYKFLGWSMSQLSDHSCWVFAGDEKGNSAESIRQQVGDLSHLEHNVSKYMARFGQIFTHSQKSVTYTFSEDMVIDKDIKRGCDVNGEEYCFSDGIGRISKPLLDEVIKNLPEDRNPDYEPCAAQIRYGGCKGMVAVDTRLEGKQLIVRESMKKFDSSHAEIEVVKLSGPAGLYLNRPVIAILSELGIKDSVFLQLQEDALNDISESLLDEERAIKLLDKRVRLGIDFKAVSKAGLHLTTDPFFSGLLRTLAQKSMGTMKRKCRIELPQEEARNMFGVLDETGILQEGEVFVQITENVQNPGKEKRVIDGDIVVTKNPAMHTGDVRKFKAIKDTCIPKTSPLWSLYDVIVFPQNGRRPHPNEMAGSDLDGDEYFVTWMKELIFAGPNHDPMDFPSSKPKIIPDVLEESDMIQFLADFIQNDRKGVIANAHLAHADKDGINSSLCNSLANKYAKAVDFQKTGYSPPMDPKERPLEYPDFMEKSNKKTYQSKKILGKLYRVASGIEHVLADYSGSTETRPQGDPILLLPYQVGNNRTLLSKAEKERDRYNDYLDDLMSQYGIRTESEVISGCINGLPQKLSSKEDTFDTEKMIKMQVKSLWKKARQNFFKQFGGEDSLRKPFPPEVVQKARAYYTVAYGEKLKSFPWIVWDVLVQAKNCATRPQMLPKRPKLEQLHDLLLSEISPFRSRKIQVWSMDLEIYGLRGIAQMLLEWASKGRISIVGNSETELKEEEFKIIMISIWKQYLWKCGSNQPLLSEFVLEFLKQCASQKFTEKDFKLKGEDKTFPPVCTERLKKLQKKSLHAYHYILQTNSVDILLNEESGRFETRLCTEFIPYQARSKTWVQLIESKVIWEKYLIRLSGAQYVNFQNQNVAGKNRAHVQVYGTNESITVVRYVLNRWWDTRQVCGFGWY